MKSKNILIVTDAWTPQINGVVTTLTNVVKKCKGLGHTVTVFSANNCKRRVPVFFYPEIVLGIPSKQEISKTLATQYDHIHISTPEGPCGIGFRKFLDKTDKNYSTAYHTKFPEYVNDKFPFVPVWLGKYYMKKIHKNSKCVLVPTMSVYKELQKQKFENIKLWSRGIDAEIFKPKRKHTGYCETEKLAVCVSRVSSEKNLEDFFKLDIDCKKIMVGGGPQLEYYKKKYPRVQFVGMKRGAELADFYQKADVFVFPSRTDTFGVVMIEALACGTPVAAYDVTGPKDIIANGLNGYIGDDLKANVEKCLKLNRRKVYESSKIHSWDTATKQFLNSLVNV